LVARLLITTADERTWPKDNNTPIIFLGEWCKLYSRKSKWKNLSSTVVPYHWDDRKLIRKDYQYLDKVYGSYLSTLSVTLNKVHNVEHTERYWRIVIGPWLRYFIEIVYDRYQSIMKASHNNVSNTYILHSELFDWVPNTHAEFSNYFTSDEYNHYLYSSIIKWSDAVPYDLISENNKPQKAIYETDNTTSLVYSINKILNKISPSLVKRISIHNSSWTLSDQLRVLSSIFQTPLARRSCEPPNNIRIKTSMRNQLTFDIACNQFEQFLQYIIPFQIPISYLEAYDNLVQSAKIYIPKSVKLIYTASGTDYNANDCFKVAAAERVENGAKLCIGQHGGHFGTGLWSSSEQHQIKISDKFYSWGWESENVKPMPSAKLLYVKNNEKRKLDGPILWVQHAAPRYAYWMYSVPVAGQYLSYFNDQVRFAKRIDGSIKKKLILRLYPKGDYGWSQVQRWEDQKLDIEIYRGNSTMLQQMSECRLIVSTYNATTFLESLVKNYPTIIFWDENLWELREEAEVYFDKLKKVGIFHDSPESAAEKVNEVCHNIELWWMEEELQSIRKQFVNEFANTSKNWKKAWSSEFKSLL